MTPVRHPHFPDVTKHVPDEDVPRWVASGWLAPEPEPADEDTRSPEAGEHDTEEETLA